MNGWGDPRASTFMSPRKVPALLMLLVLALPGALAHGEENHVEPGREPDTGESLAPNSGYTGPGREPYVSFIEGVWLYGQASVSPLHHNTPRHIRGWDGWLVWEDSSRGDIYLHGVDAGTGYYLTNDPYLQRNPEIWGNVVVYEDYRHGRADVYAHFIDTGETRRLSTGPGNHRNPSIHGDLVAWESDRNRTGDVWAISLLQGEEFPIHDGPDKESDPLVLDGVVYFRTYRFNVWDVMGYEVEAGELYQLTNDARMQSAPFTNGREVLFLTQTETAGWRLDRYDAARERPVATPIRAPDSSRLPASGDHLVQQARDVGWVQLVARNITSGTTTHVSGNLALVTDPHIEERTVYAAVKTKTGVSLLALDVSPFAFGKQPSLTITSPTRSVMPWVRPLVVQGLLTTGPGWNEPVTFTYRINDQAPQVIPPGQTWRVTLDPYGFTEGNHEVRFRATFREGPPVEASLTLVVPLKNAQVDVAELGPQWHAAKTMAALQDYVLDNPASWLLIPLVLILALLLLIRLWLILRPRREIIVAEYVPQETD